MMKRMLKMLLSLLCAALLVPSALAEAAAVDLPEHTEPVLQVHQINLGCANGYLLKWGDMSLMIDGGNAYPAHPTDDVQRYLRASGIDKLDAYIITHWHLDHCMNLNLVLAEFGDENTIVYSPSTELHPDYAPLAAGTYQQMTDGQEVMLGNLKINCVGPETLKQNGRCNADSLNFVVTYGQRRFLFTGDFAASGNFNNKWTSLISGVDVLQFPHHAIEPFEIGSVAMAHVRPTYIVVPGAVTPYKIWDWMDDHGTRIVKEHIYTNGNGNITFMTDGDWLRVYTQVELGQFAGEAYR